MGFSLSLHVLIFPSRFLKDPFRNTVSRQLTSGSPPDSRSFQASSFFPLLRGAPVLDLADEQACFRTCRQWPPAERPPVHCVLSAPKYPHYSHFVDEKTEG